MDFSILDINTCWNSELAPLKVISWRFSIYNPQNEMFLKN